jgi:hypothetical protein
MGHDDFEDTELRPKRESLPQPYIIHELPQPRLQVDASSSALTEDDTASNGITGAEELDSKVILDIETDDLATPLVDTDIDQIEFGPFSPLPVKHSFVDKEREMASTLNAEEREQTDIQEEMEAENDSVPSGTTDQPIVDIAETLTMTPNANNETVLEVPETPTLSLSLTSDKEEKAVMEGMSETAKVTEENQVTEAASSAAQTVDIPLVIKDGTTDTPNEPQTSQDKSQRPTHVRRTSVAQVAQSYLGDKLEDLTEKLTFIKKNIIMSLEEDEDEEDEFADSTYTPRPSRSQQMRPKAMPKPHLTTSETLVAQR